MKKVIVGFSFVMLMAGFSSAKELYRAPSAGDKGTYYIIDKKQVNNMVQVLTSRIGKNNAYTDFTKLRINCDTKQFFVLAGSEEDGAKDNPSSELKDYSQNSKWTSLVQGSSKYDLVMYVCN
jgi:hypothetical protein